MEARLALSLLVLALYLSLGTLLAVLSRRRLASLTEREYYIAGGRLGAFLSAMTYAATTYSAFMIVGLVGFAYALGVGSLGFELAYFVATLALLTAFAPRVWRMARERGWVTPGDMLADLLGSRALAILAGLIYLVALIPYASAQLKGIGEAVAGLAGGSSDAYVYGVALGIIVMIVWSLVAGIWSVAVTDALQGLWMIFAGTALLVWLLGKIEGTIGLGTAADMLVEEGLMSLGEFWKFNVFLAFTIPWVFFAVTNPQVVQRLYMPRDERSLAGMIRWFGVFGLYYTVLVTLIGLLARAGSVSGILPTVENKDQVTPTLLSLAHPLLSAMVFTSIVAAAVSTADSILLTLASSASRDLSLRAGERSVLRGVISALLVAAAMVAVAIKRPLYIVGLSVASSMMLLPLAPVTIAAWLGKRPGAPASVFSVLAGEAILAYEVAELMSAGKSLKALFVIAPWGLPVPAWQLIVSTVIVLLALLLKKS